MKELKEGFVEIYRSERGIVVMMILNVLLAVGVMVFALMQLNPSSPVVKVGYGDIGGYRDGAWYDMLAYPILMVVFGGLNTLLAARIYNKRGGRMTKFFLITTTCLILGTLLVLIRLLKEG